MWPAPGGAGHEVFGVRVSGGREVCGLTEVSGPGGLRAWSGPVVAGQDVRAGTSPVTR